MGRGHIVAIFSLAACLNAFAAAPALREQVSLNGPWTIGGTVPEYTGIKSSGVKTYERTVTVPGNWTGKVVKLEFNAVNHIADVYVNNVLLTRHIGGWTPFSIDLTNRVAAGATFTLKVVVTGTDGIKSASGKVQWPVGGWNGRLGISDDVWLRAYGKVHIQDAYIKTAVGAGTLTVDYTLRNDDTVNRTVTVFGDAIREGSTTVEKTVSATVTLAAGETKVVTAQAGWTNATRYTPETPVLYHLKSRVVLSSATVDQETRRFGFREITRSGNQLYWNGIRCNLYGDYQSYPDDWYVSSSLHTPANWPGTIDKLKALNIRCLRWHHNPVPQYVLDICDEKGLLICDEAPNYGREYLQGMTAAEKATYVANFKTWCKGWIIADRNHPSIYIWNATNEMTYSHLGSFTAAECRAMGDELRKYDTTRPVGYDGDNGAAQETLNHHYPEGYNYQPSGSIYGWANKVSATQPTGSGEMLHTKTSDSAMQTNVERNKWWLGIWTRGLRYTNWTDVRPACYWFASADLNNSDPKWQQRGRNLKNAYAPVALFDKAYDDLGIAPYVTGTTPGGTLPSVTEGATLSRTLVLYNDEFSNTTVSIETLVKIGGTTHATGSKTFTVPLGSHIDIPCSFQAPYVASSTTLEWILRTYKNGTLKFEESRRFTLNDAGLNGTSSPTVSITGGQNAAPTVTLTSPSNGAGFTAPANVHFTANAADSDGSISRVEFLANGSVVNTDTAAPYDFTWGSVDAGSYTLAARATDNTGAQTTSGTVTINVTAAATQAVVSFTLVNADSDTDISPLSNGMTINLSQTPTRNLNVRANTNPPTVGSVRFAYDGNANFHLENGGPYAFYGGTGNNYLPWTPTQGAHTIGATPFTAANATGTAGSSLYVSFNVIDPPRVTSGPTATGGALSGQPVNFSVAASDPNNDALTYAWNFGDGTTGSGSNPSHVYAAAGNYTGTVTVSDGNGGTVTATLTVTVSAPPTPGTNIRINFQLAGGPVPAGYLADTGAPFGNRGNGHSYGWNADNSATARDRNSPVTQDQRYDTLQHMQKPVNPDARWELALPNGNYRVRIVAGDPSYFDSVFKINAENTLANNFTPTSTTRWSDSTVVVTVGDGRLTLSNASGAMNNKLCFVEVTSATSAAIAANEAQLLPMNVIAASALFARAKPNADSVKLSLELPIVGDETEYREVGVDVGGIVEMIPLSKGRGKTKHAALKLTRDAGRSMLRVSLTLNKGTWPTVLQDCTRLSGDAKAGQLLLPIALTLDGQAYGGGKVLRVKRSKTAESMK